MNNEVVEDTGAYIKSKKKGQTYIPQRGWQYAGGGWPDDETLTVIGNNIF